MRIVMLLHKSVEHDSRVRREAGALAGAGHEVCVVELVDLRDSPRSLEGFSRTSASPPGWMRRRLPRPLYRAAFLVWFVRRGLRLRPEVVHAHDAAMLLPGLLVARCTGALLVYDSHELATSVPYRERFWAWFVAAVERLSVPRADAVVTVSDGIAERLHERYDLAGRPTVLRNVSALVTDGPGSEGGLRTRLGLGEQPLLLHQGAAATGRGAEDLVRAVALLPGVHLVFLGDGEAACEGRVRDLAVELDVADRVHLLGSVPLERLLEHTREADLGLSMLEDTCENHRLALPNKVFEYLAAGVPVVVNDLPELRRLVGQYGIGWVAGGASPVRLAATLRTALEQRDDPALAQRLAVAGRELRWEVEQRRLLELFEELASRRVRRRRAVVLVRTDARTDARVRRQTRLLSRDGFEVTALAVRARPDLPVREEAEGAVVERFELLTSARRLRARLSAVRGRRRTQAQAPPPASASSSPGATPREPRKLLRVRRALASAHYQLLAARRLARLRPDLVHANDHNTMPAAAVARLLGARVVYDSHELWADRNGRIESRRALIALEALWVRLGHATITTSPGYADVLARRYRVPRPRLVRNVTSAEGRVGRVVEHGFDPIAAYIGAVTRHRGLEQAIEALAHVPRLRLIVIGPQAHGYAGELRALAARHGVADRLELRAPLRPEDIPEALAALRPAFGLALIQPVCLSYRLSLPNKLYEYALGGVPVLGTDLPVIADWLWATGVGRTVDAAEGPQRLGEAMEAMLDPDAQRAWRERAQQLIDARPWLAEERALASVYADVLAGGRRHSIRRWLRRDGKRASAW
jgi:glycosyltransferase involved in cell wall biosynthesis